MEITKTLQAGEMGTKRFLAQHGNKLICVRYRKDTINKKRYTTVELIVDEKPYFSSTSYVYVWIKIDYEETQLRQKVKSLGAQWQKQDKAWCLKYDVAKKLGILDRVYRKEVITHG